MKKEIESLLKSENQTLRINEYCCLNRWQKDALNQDVDMLVLEFKNFYGKYNKNVEIKSRDCSEIIKIVETEIKNFFEGLGNCLSENFKNGYLC